MATAAPKRHRSFTRDHREKKTPISFDVYDETFEAWPEMQGAVLLELVAAMTPSISAVASEDEDESPMASADSIAAILDFFRIALKPESYTRFQALIHHPEKIVEIEDLTDIISWLMEQYTDRS